MNRYTVSAFRTFGFGTRGPGRPSTVPRQEIVERYASDSDMTLRALASEYGVSGERIRQIINDESPHLIASRREVRRRIREALEADRQRQIQERRASYLKYQHGTGSCYTAGCRCDECRAAATARTREARARRIERGRADPSLIPHGLGGYENWACRCEVCSGEHQIRMREYQRRYKQAARP